MTASASAPLAPLAMTFRINESLISRALDGLTEDQLWQRPTEFNNPMLWLVGHLVRSRARLLSALGDTFVAQPASGPVPVIKTVADLATFLTMHESYHVGQLAYIRESLGLPGLIG